MGESVPLRAGPLVKAICGRIIYETSSHRIFELNGLRKSTPPQNLELVVLIGNCKH